MCFEPSCKPLYLKSTHYGHCVVLFMPKTHSLGFRLSPTEIEYVTGSVTVAGMSGMSWGCKLFAVLLHFATSRDSPNVLQGRVSPSSAPVLVSDFCSRYRRSAGNMAQYSQISHSSKIIV